MPLRLPSFRARRNAYPPDLWTKCPQCEEMLFNKQLDKALRVCPNCGHHFRLSAAARLDQLLDPGSWLEHDAGLLSVDPLGFVDSKTYPDRLAAAQLATGMRDAAVWGTATLGGSPVAICVMDFGFMGGSMGAVVGEKVTRAAEHALATATPLIVVSASGGARMQEGTFALMQLAKTLAAVERLRGAGIPFLSVLCDPTTGGVFASFAAVGDVNIAEPERADRVRRVARLGRARSPRSCRSGSSARSSCSPMASSTGSWLARGCATSSPACCDCCRSGHRPSPVAAGRRSTWRASDRSRS